MSPSNSRVAVAMSGGVDSSTTAAILKKQGNQVVGLTMLLSDDIDNDAMLADARKVAGLLHIDHQVCDFRSRFKSTVIADFISDYENGKTPNPCVNCNRNIKFGSLLEEALKLNANYLATGHYVRIDRGAPSIRLLKGIDQKKDQSYFLYRLQQQQLEKIIFPLGTFRKEEIRKMATDIGLSVAEKKESQDLCFIGRGDYREFLKTRSAVESKPGPIIDSAGIVLGEHRGLWNYTIGQRRGLGVAYSEPLYVVELDIPNNTLIVATDSQRGKGEFIIEEVSLISGDIPKTSFNAGVKIRYTAKEIAAEITPLAGKKARVHLTRQLPDITPGQSAVFYQGEELIGGGYIT